jgi:hypothetical protein
MKNDTLKSASPFCVESCVRCSESIPRCGRSIPDQSHPNAHGPPVVDPQRRGEGCGAAPPPTPATSGVVADTAAPDPGRRASATGSTHAPPSHK